MCLDTTVPRAEVLKAYFQDDVYPPCRSKEPSVSVSDWREAQSSGAPVDLTPAFDSLQPADMAPLSAKPEGPARVSRVISFREDIQKSEQELKKKEDTFAKLQDLAIQRAVYHPNASGGSHGFKCDVKPVHDSEDVADDEWD